MQLGFDIDWSGLATNLAQGALQYTQQRNAVKLQMAQLQVQTAQQLRAMQPPAARQPTLIAAPGQAGAAARQQMYAAPRSALPSWAVPVGAAAAAVGVVFLLTRPRG